MIVEKKKVKASAEIIMNKSLYSSEQPTLHKTAMNARKGERYKIYTDGNMTGLGGRFLGWNLSAVAWAGA